MLLNKLRYIPQHYVRSQNGFHVLRKVLLQKTNPAQIGDVHLENKETLTSSISAPKERIIGEIFPSPRVVPMVLTNKESVVLSFEEVPGPKSLKYLSNFRQYLSDIGTQLTACALTVGLNVGTYVNSGKPVKNLSSLFDQYGPVVRFVSPIGGDIVLINHPEHIEKVYTMEGVQPVRSTLDCLEKYRREHRNQIYGGLYNIQGEEWTHKRAVIQSPLSNAVTQHIHGIIDVCDGFTQKLYTMRSYQDEVKKDLYKEIHKWAFDCMGLLIFSKKFTMLDTELVYNQCDMSWLYQSLQKSTEAIMKCESGLHLWKIMPTPAWRALVKHCDSLDNLIGKHVLEAEQKLAFVSSTDETAGTRSLINAMLLSEDKMRAEDIATVLMDMLLIGVNTITSSTSFLLYYLAKHQKVQKSLYKEISKLYIDLDINEVKRIKEDTPYLQACIKETLRLVPPIPVLTRILPKNITLDKYNIPRGTLIIMSTQDASLKESNFEDATKFYPERWLTTEASEYHSFASIPFGFGARKCLGQSIAETMMSLVTIKVLQKYKLEYHYGDIIPTRSFIARPNKPMKIRFVDRIEE